MEKGKELKSPTKGGVWKSEGFLKGSGIREADSDEGVWNPRSGF